MAAPPAVALGNVTGVRRAVVFLVAGLLTGTAFAQSTQEPPEAKVVRPKDLVAVQGPAPVGRFFVKAGADSLNSDLYQMTFSPPGFDRLTTDARVTTVGACPDKVVVAAAQREVGYADRLQELAGDKLVPVETLGLEAGSDPDLAEDCRILYSRLAPGAGSELAQEIRLWDPAKGAASTVTSGATVRGAGWGPGGEIAVLKREPAGPRLQIIKPDGTSTEIDPQVADVGNTPWGKSGWMALAVFSQPGQPPTGTLFLNPATGERSPLDGWLPLAWSPDGTQLLVAEAKDGTTLAVVELADLTRTRNVGVSTVGTVWDAVWLPAGG
ncbi:MAG: hypothetical protein ACRDZ3_23025 [Acidimicrobiia bacterium]